MEDPLPYYSIAFLVLLLLSAFFSGAETAFFSINSITSKQLQDEKKSSAKRVLFLLSQSRRLLISILIGNTLVNVSAASLSAMLTTRLSIEAGLDPRIVLVLNVVVVTFLILVFSEITPKIIAVKNAKTFAQNVSLVILSIYYLFWPFSWILEKVINWLTDVFKIKESKEERFFHSDEFQALLDLGEEQGELEEEEKEMIHSIFEFGDTIVREIMVPRTDVVCVQEDASISDLIRVIKEKGHTRIPVYEETIDKIIGIINAKDLLSFISSGDSGADIKSLARGALFVPESKKIDDLLRLFQKERQHMAIVVDEYGGTAGIVTLEDVIEEIVGDIRDEYDKEQALYKKTDENNYLVNAKIDIESLNDLIAIEIPVKDDYDTLGGFILEQTGSVPEPNQVVQYNQYKLMVNKVENNRIILVKISYHPHDEDEATLGENL